MNSLETLKNKDLEPLPILGPDDQRRALWLFYLFGEGRDEQEALRPAALEAMRQQEQIQFWPLLVGQEQDRLQFRSFGSWLDEALKALESEGTSCQVLRANAPFVTNLCMGLLDEIATPLVALMAKVSKALPEALDLSAAGRKALNEELAALTARLPSGLSAYTTHRDTALCLYLRMLEANRGKRREQLAERVSALVQGLKQILLLADIQADQDPQKLASSLGLAGSHLINPQRMAINLPRNHGSQTISAERRARIQNCLNQLIDFQSHPERYPNYYFLHSEDYQLPTQLVAGMNLGFANCLGTAVANFEILVKGRTQLLLACRVAKLEISGEYDSQLHDSVLSRLTWECLTEEELRFLPAITAVESAETIRADFSGSYSELLGSGLPIQVILYEDRPERERIRQDLAWQAINFREVLVNATSPVLPDHLVASFDQVIRTDICSVTVIACPGRLGTVTGEAFIQSRITPLYRYLGSDGTGLADRFFLNGNPQPQVPWPQYRLSLAGDGDPAGQLLSFTFADAAALCRSLRSHFYLIPQMAWNDEDQVPIHAYRGDTTRPQVPYIWVLDEHNQLQRVAITRILAQACENRRRFWASLQEMGGINNQHAERAALQARETALTESRSEISTLEAGYRAELERVRQETAQEAMERLARFLLEVDDREIMLPAQPSPQPTQAQLTPPPSPEPLPQAEPPAAEVEEESFTEEAFIDSELCTSCNECINLNPLLFRYNGDKQAFIGDLSKGTYLQLVTAAEKCPAHIIHPGQPRADDPTATPEIVQRGAHFY